MIRKFRERLSCCSCEQCAKVEPKISMTSVWGKSTVCSCWQLAQAADPILLKSGGRESATMPASKKQQSGKHRFGSLESFGLQEAQPRGMCGGHDFHRLNNAFAPGFRFL